MNFRNSWSGVLLLIVFIPLFIFGGCDCGDDDDDDDGAPTDDDADDDSDDDVDDDGSDDDTDGPPIVDCIPPLDYDGDGDVEFLLESSIPDEYITRLYLVEPGTFERGEPILEYDVTNGDATFQTADFDGNDVWDIVVDVETDDLPTTIATYEIYMNGDFSAPAHTLGPYAESAASSEFMDTDGNGLPEMMVVAQGSSKAEYPEQVQKLIDTDNDFSEIADFAAPDSIMGDDLEFVPEVRLGGLWPFAGAITGESETPELFAYASYEVPPAFYKKMFVFDATTGALLVESPPYYLGDSADWFNTITVSDVDGDGRGEAVMGYTEAIADPPGKTGFAHVFGGPELAAEWSSPQYADSSVLAAGIVDFNLDGLIDPAVTYSNSGTGERGYDVLNGADGYGEIFHLDSSTEEGASIALQKRRSYLASAYNFRGIGTEVFVLDREIDGSDATGQLRSLDMGDGSLSGVLVEFDLGVDGSIQGDVLDFGRDGVLDLVVLYKERYESGGDWVDIVFLEVMTSPSFYEVFHVELEDGYTYYLKTDLDLTGDSSPDMVVSRIDKVTGHNDFLVYACDSTGCDSPVEVDYGEDESFSFRGPML